MRSSRTQSQRSLSSTPGSRAIGGKALQTKPRPCLYHCVQSERSWMREGKPEWTVRRLLRRKQIHLCLAEVPPYQLLHHGVEPQVSTGCLLLHCGPPGCKLLEETATSLGTTGEFGTPVCKVDVTVNPPGDVLSERMSKWWPLRSARKFLRARNTANISRWLMCHERWWSFHRPWLERPSRVAPQPVREASVVSILRLHEAPNTGPWDRNQSFFHITKARKHRRMTLIMQNGLPFWENPLVLSHHCRGLMYSSPKYITLDAAAIKPISLWNCLTVSDWPSLILFHSRQDGLYTCRWQAHLHRRWVPCHA